MLYFFLIYTLFSACKGTTIRKASQGQFIEKYILFFISRLSCLFAIYLELHDIWVLADRFIVLFIKTRCSIF